MFLIDNFANMLKDIFLTDLLDAKKKCNNLIDEFDNMKECMIDFVNRQIIKNNNIINQIIPGL